MNAVETLQAVIGDIEANDFVRARGLLADDFVFGGAVPEPIGPDAWLGIHKAFNAAMPDFRFNASNYRDDNGAVTLQVQITGTQTRELVLPIPGMPAIPATGKHVALPAEPIRATARGDKLATLTVSEIPGGGLPGLLSQLGVSLPAHA
ncbi:MAG TPA: nuclear transport factor 2 family protein [Ktedonobacterales bacterium]|jgi:hypothetical protein